MYEFVMNSHLSCHADNKHIFWNENNRLLGIQFTVYRYKYIVRSFLFCFIPIAKIQKQNIWYSDT